MCASGSAKSLLTFLWKAAATAESKCKSKSKCFKPPKKQIDIDGKLEARNKLVHKLCEMDLLVVQKVLRFVVAVVSCSVSLLGSQIVRVVRVVGGLIWLICHHLACCSF